MYIGNEQLLEAATSFKTSQSNGNNIPEIGNRYIYIYIYIYHNL